MERLAAIEIGSLTIVLLPLLSGLLTFASKNFRLIRDWVMPFTALATLINFIFLAKNYLKTQVISHDFFISFGNFIINFRIDYISLLFFGIVLSLWFITSLYLKSYIHVNKLNHQTSFLIFINLAISCTLLVGLATDKIVMFIGYELLTLMTYPLVLHYQDQHSRQAANKYLTMLLTTSLSLLLTGLMLINIAKGNDSFSYLLLALVLILLGTAKVAIMPFNSWLPAAMVAPTPVSALLHAVAVVKTGAILIIKIIAYEYGYEKLHLLYLNYNSLYLIILGYLLANIIISSIKAINAHEIKQVLAYSTIANLSYIVFIALIPHKYSIKAAMVMLIAHALAKIGLFLATGIITTSFGIKKVKDLAGTATQLVLTSSVIIIASISLWGMPPLLGFWAKKLLFTQLKILPWEFQIGFIISSILSVIYLGKIIGQMFQIPESGIDLELKINPNQITWMQISVALLLGLYLGFTLLGYYYFA